MTRCQICNRSSEDGAYAQRRAEPRASDRKLECIECCMKREARARARVCVVGDYPECKPGRS